MGTRMLLLGLIATLGCYSYRPTAPLPAPATTVRVSFLSPRDVVARSPAGDSILMTAVKELRGSVVRAQLDMRMDSIRVRLGSAHGANGVISGVPDGSVAMVPREVFVRMEQRSFDAGKTLRWTGLIVGAILLATLLLTALAVSEAPGY